ncbi:MAG: VWA domain-containing protein [Hamadaea sp.]|uniref:substrate-binding and VWA domain-containing protein n=1 Tax=Hamadaea sp. TaxID=2024425 RepID=UPI00180DC405|nr:substrate-binding and VWA domain-containing protein [Hamadaea sp.]NUR72260.1 VWA domain-containing protein [Hamadaea sp.]NUT17691.1 VWA domain-containing protein [Hamadaea sp.]
MAGRHRPRRGPGQLTLAVAGATVLLLGLGILVKNVAADADGCGTSTGTRLVVAADPAIAPALIEIANSWQQTAAKEVSSCVSVEVQPRSSAEMANGLGTYSGGTVDIGTSPVPTPTESDLPAVWIPDSTAWLGRVRAIDRDAFDLNTPSVAISPVVVGMPEALARQLGSTALDARAMGAILADGKVKLGMTDPRRDTASLAGAMLLKDVVVTQDADLPKLVGAFRLRVNTDKAYADTKDVFAGFATGLGAAPVSEQSVIQYNAGNPAVKVAAVPLAVEPTLDFPYAILAQKSPKVKAAAEAFRSALSGEAYADVLGRHGLRTPSGAAGPGFTVGHGVTASQAHVQPVTDMTSVRTVLSIWVAAKTPSKVITLADVTSSMSLPLNASGKTRLKLMQESATHGLTLFTSDSQLALWGFAGRGTQPLVPMGTLDKTQRQKLDQTMQAAQLAATDECPLFEALLSAYKSLKAAYDPERSNTIVVFTDGKSNLTGGLTLAKLKLELEALVDVARPIRVILLGIGSADLGELTQIAEITGGGAFPLTAAGQLDQIFLKALLA